MANFHLRDKSLSLKAVGLLSKMLSFNDMKLFYYKHHFRFYL